MLLHTSDFELRRHPELLGLRRWLSYERDVIILIEVMLHGFHLLEGMSELLVTHDESRLQDYSTIIRFLAF